MAAKPTSNPAALRHADIDHLVPHALPTTAGDSSVEDIDAAHPRGKSRNVGGLNVFEAATNKPKRAGGHKSGKLGAPLFASR